MSKIIGIIDYGVAGNIHSIKKAVEKAGGEVNIIKAQKDFSNVDKIIIPGVGSFKNMMEKLTDLEIIEILKNQILNKPTLGICLGMQILATLGFEYGKTFGLNIIKSEVKPMIVDAKVPHMGFYKLKMIEKCSLFDGIENEEFYFMHSYEMVNYTDVVALANYENHEFISAVRKNNIYGVQFHPEKSREAGIRMFKNFIEL